MGVGRRSWRQLPTRQSSSSKCPAEQGANPGMCKSQRLLKIVNSRRSRQSARPKKPLTTDNLATYEDSGSFAKSGGEVAGRGTECLYERFHSLLHSFNVTVSDNKPRYSGGAMPSASMDSNRVEFFRNARFTLPVGPLRCLAIMSSAFPCRSGSSCL